jgi:hypothetical protein
MAVRVFLMETAISSASESRSAASVPSKVPRCMRSGRCELRAGVGSAELVIAARTRSTQLF